LCERKSGSRIFINTSQDPPDRIQGAKPMRRRTDPNLENALPSHLT